MAFVKGVTTPTLILHGEADVRVPTSQGYEFYNALKRQGVTDQDGGLSAHAARAARAEVPAGHHAAPPGLGGEVRDTVTG